MLQVLINQQPITSREVLLRVARPRVERERFQYVRAGGNITLNCYHDQEETNR